jgi:hypothetical protein
MQDIPPERYVLTAEQRRSLRCLADIMIPASAEYGVPGAGDELIFGDILRSIGQDARHVAAVAHRLVVLAGGEFAELDATRRTEVAMRLRAEGGEALTYTTRLILECYYRDDRVMRALGMEPRPPFPQGFEVEQGDWSLLDPVRKRSKIWRDAP